MLLLLLLLLLPSCPDVRRVFSDRLVDDKDMDTFVSVLTEKLGLLFDQTFHNICPGKQAPTFGENQGPHSRNFLGKILGRFLILG